LRGVEPAWRVGIGVEWLIVNMTQPVAQEFFGTCQDLPYLACAAKFIKCLADRLVVGGFRRTQAVSEAAQVAARNAGGNVTNRSPLGPQILLLLA